jgi:hypothetical protein
MGNSSRYGTVMKSREVELLVRGGLDERFWSKVDKYPLGSWTLELGPCWLWTQGCNNKGYGRYYILGVPVTAHRVSYIAEYGAIQSELELDHLCRVRHCVRPAHLEPVTSKINSSRGETGLHNAQKSHCPHGHPYDVGNTRIKVGKDGYRRRVCKACDSVAKRRGV